MGTTYGQFVPGTHLILEDTNETPNENDPVVLKFVGGETGEEHEIAFSNGGARIEREFFQWLAQGAAHFHSLDIYDLTTGRFYSGRSKIWADMTTDQRMYARGET